MGWQVALGFFVSLFLTCAVASAPDCHPGKASEDERLTEFLALPHDFDYAEGNFETLVGQVVERFGALWCDRAYGAELEEASDAQVAVRLRAAKQAAFYARPDWVLNRLRSAAAAAYARGIADSTELVRVLTAFQAAGRYEEARQFRDDYPAVELPDVPRLSPPAVPRPDQGLKVWHVDGEANRLRGDWLEIREPRLLIVTSPGCGYCRAAARELPADDVLGPLMRDHAVWLAERSMNNSFRSLAWWNREFPETPTLLVDDPSAWPVPDFTSTPRFHFVRGGEIVHTLAGWRGGAEGLRAIADGFERLDLLETSSLSQDAFAYADKPSPTRGCPERDEARKRIRARAPINTRDELDRHLAELREGSDSPLASLSQEGRKRFVASMRFADDGALAGFSYGELKAELQPREIYRVTALFGQQYAYAGRLFDSDLLSEDERALDAMLHCE